LGRKAKHQMRNTKQNVQSRRKSDGVKRKLPLKSTTNGKQLPKAWTAG
jgi:hypothetical protein